LAGKEALVTFAQKIRQEAPAGALVPSLSNSKGLKLDPSPLLGVSENKVDFDLLEKLSGRSVVSARQLDRQTVVELCKFSGLLEITEIAAHHPLDGKLVVTAFFEASTRTRLSFESAVLRLDGKVVSVPDGRVTGTAKGESLEDIGEMLNTYGDLVVVRHPETDSVDRLLTNLHLPLINAGNGSGEHPTQALLDWYTIFKWRPELMMPDCPEEKRIHIGIVGTPGSMRAVNSFLLLALLFPGGIKRITIVSELADALGEKPADRVEASPIEVVQSHNLEQVIDDLDLIYLNSIAFLGDSYRNLGSRFKLSADSRLKKDAVVMHPLARNNELDPSLDDTHHNLYFAQAASAVFLRQALLIALLGRIPNLPPSIRLLTHK
jgi:aspartate carbamoyltransferase catalytic subunit